MRVVFCSVPVGEAKGLARKIIEARVAACVQIVPQVQSVYHWKGDVCEDEEALLLIKTDASVLQELTTLIKQAHSYSVPEIVSVAIEDGEGNLDYLQWLRQEVGQTQK